MDWISIEDKEPPKDGTPFLCFDPDRDNWWVAGAPIYVVSFVQKDSFRNEAYVEAGGERYHYWNPTHWMPLPSPPVN